MNHTVSDTINLIKKLHEGQKYGNDPYYKHPVQVMMKAYLAERIALEDLATANGHNFTHMRILLNRTDPLLHVALLHDVVEDTAATGKDLLAMGYSLEIVDAVVLLTKPEEMNYLTYVKELIQSNNELAIKIKFADNLCNTGTVLTSPFSQERKDRMIKKYNGSIALLKEYLNK